MKAKQRLKRRIILSEDSFVELLIWGVLNPVPASQHNYKYGLALVHKGNCVFRYDNNSGKGDHKHIGENKFPYHFRNVDQLIADFLEDVRRWQDEYSNT